MNDKASILSSRIRLARNMEDFNMPVKMSEIEAREIKNRVKDALEKESVDFESFDVKDLSKVELDQLIENRVISKELTFTPEISSFLVTSDGGATIMLNEEDHIRIQTIKPDFDLWEAWEDASKLDDLIDRNTDYAFDSEFGYLTTCPTNTGTGLRASVMVHLPFLTAIGGVSNLASSVGKVGVVIRGYYGEGSEPYGGIYQISNQTTLGNSEEDIIRKVEAISTQIIYRESLARRKALQENELLIEDKIFRAYGILKNSRILELKESMDHLSALRVGIYLELLDIEKKTLDDLTMMTQNANIVKQLNRIDINEINKKRAELFREQLA